ncbi:MAG: extracellular elastinolytic metalloproteinase [Nocardioidaceae bacterium]|nr:extracellular elastinolytic metalloproteinase [Nocardioidaceae bacterium]
MSTSPSTRNVAALAIAALTTGGLMAVTPTASGQPSPHAVDARTRVHWSHGKALGAASHQGAARTVRSYLSAHGLTGATPDSLRRTSSWTVKGVKFVRLQEYAGGLRVVDSDIKAALDKRGRVISLVENASPVSTPAAARITAAQAQSAAVRSLYHGRHVSYLQAPSVERVAVPMSNGRLAEGFLVTTWDTDNQLRQTVVDGHGKVVRSELRTAEDGYNIFPQDPGKTPQTLISNPADPVASPSGWLSGLSQFVDDINGNNAHAYIDANADNAPDPAGAPDTDGVFDKVFNPNIQPTAGDNKAVAVQNLFYLNNKIHDLLYRAGFTPAAGNFQTSNFGLGGKGGDPVLAEAQDGSGTDNANFATPVDGTSGRMQMYLWSVPGTSEVAQNGTSYDAPVAEFSAPLTVAGVSGPLAVANDGTGTTSDACETVAPVAAGTVVIADRGTCDFVTKAANIKAAGGAGVIIANNAAGSPVVMGGTIRKFDLPAVMVSQAAGTALKAGAPSATTIRLVDPAPPRKDGDLDSDIVYHEYGHGLTWRMIGRMSGDVAGGIGEGMGDTLSIIINNDPVVGEYAFSDPAGIRSHSYEGYNRTYAQIPFDEVHDTGELYGAIMWDLWKRYQAASLGQSDILFDLVQGMNFTPAKPTFEDMRQGILDGLTADSHGARTCMVWNAFATYGVGVGSVAKVSGAGAKVTQSFAVPPGC